MTTSKQQPRGIRNNNFGNLRRSSDKWQGLRPVQTDPEFFQFTAPEWGYRALIKTLQTYRNKYGLQTIAELISRWAPPTENHTSAYIAAVCGKLQVPSTYTPNVNDRATMVAIASAISEVENGIPAIREDVERGWALV